MEEEIYGLGMDKWLSHIIIKSIRDVGLCNKDFRNIYPDDELLCRISNAMGYYATIICNEYKLHIEVNNIGRKKNMENDLSHLDVVCKEKMSSIKTKIRMYISYRVKNQPVVYTPGAFVGFDDMYKLFIEKNPRNFTHGIHRLGVCPQDDPRYYIHMIYRLYLDDIHRILVADKKVVRQTCIFKIMDAMYGITSVGSHLNSDFQRTIRMSSNKNVPIYTLHVPCKINKNGLVSKYNFEKIPWVPILRRKIHDAFTKWCQSKPDDFLKFYPRCFIMGNNGNRELALVNERAIKMEEVIHIHESMGVDGSHEFFNNLLEGKKGAGKILESYRTHNLLGTGESLVDKYNFFFTEEIISIFRSITKNNGIVCNTIYKNAGVSTQTVDIFKSLCKGKEYPMAKAGPEMIRFFLSDIIRICSIFYSMSNMIEVGANLTIYGTIDNYIRESISRIV